jgi:protein gp37
MRSGFSEPPLGPVGAGGESGPEARPINPHWVRSIRDQCVQTGVAFHFKQWGGTNKKATGRVLDGVVWDQRPSKTMQMVA